MTRIEFYKRLRGMGVSPGDIARLETAGYESARDAHDDFFAAGVDVFGGMSRAAYVDFCLDIGRDFVLDNPDIFDIFEEV